MLKLAPVTLADKDWVDEIVFAEGARSADFNFGNLYIWNKLYHHQIGSVGDRLIILVQFRGGLCFACPIGTGPLESAISAMAETAKEKGFPLSLYGLTEKYVELFEKTWPGRFTFTSNADRFDYVYSAQKLANLEGKKLHGKRNHINRFIQENNWTFSPLEKADIPECLALAEEWLSDAPEAYASGVEAERTALNRAFVHYDELKLDGGVLRSGGRLVAFTVGELISKDTFNVHFEKAYATVNGAYPMINREFVRYLLELYPGVEYINREEDLGIENLRKAKMSYIPELLVHKYTATEGNEKSVCS